VRALALAVALALAALPAVADRPRLPPNAAYQAECASCHVPYPPGLLPASSWQQLMSELEKHFGSDASLEVGLHAEISRYLAANAGRRASPVGAEPRITRTRWFLKEHRKEIPAGKNPADCGACHTEAEKGIYEDD
jgi:hypothetical protein